MKYFVVAAATLLACVSAERNHPVVKVIALIEDLKAKAISEGKTEALGYEKFQYWCRNSQKTLSKAVAEEEETISSLTDEIAAKDKEAESLTEDISDLAKQLSEMDASAAAAKAARGEGNALYVKVSADLQGTISAVDLVIKELAGAKAAGPSLVEMQEGALLSDRQLRLLRQPATRQVLAMAEARSESGPQRHMLATLLQQPTKSSHVKKYQFKSGNVIEIVKTLKLSFEDELSQATKEETNAANAYELAKKARDNAMKAARASKTEKTVILADVRQALIGRKADLASTQGDLTADSASLQQTEKECSMKAQEWEERSAVRSQELEAMDVAMKILAKAANVRAEAPGNPVMPPSPLDAPAASFLQVVDPKEKALNLLRQTARKTHSLALERLAQQLSLHKNGAFSEVNNMIEKMIFKLMDEQRQEDEHKLWCDKEISTTNSSIEDKTDKLEELDGKLGIDKNKNMELAVQIADANKMISDITSFMQEATDIRATGKEENAAALKDAQDSQTALANAIAVLEAFYKESGMVQDDFLQRSAAPVELPKDPSTWDSGYTGVSDPAAQPGGIVAVLKKVAADFAKMEADTRAQEATDQQAYDQEMSECKIEKARRAKEVEMKNAESDRLTEKIASLEQSRNSVKKELDLTAQYMKDLAPACIDGGSTYEDRKKARAEETEALRQAQGILADAFKETPSLAQSAPKFLEARRHVA
mmetsp:Transcript_4055/g.11005  ORF Transcript_4055/g.11005 Transcript_4055/m.11005 type:complete len:711 (-) Transcript_4055:89-2221(-)